MKPASFLFRPTGIPEAMLTSPAEVCGGLFFTDQTAAQHNGLFFNGPGQRRTGQGRRTVGDENDIAASAFGTGHGHPSFTDSIAENGKMGNKKAPLTEQMCVQ